MTDIGLFPAGTMFMTRSETAAFLRVSPITIYRLVERGLLPAYHLCRKLLFKHEDVIAFAESTRRERGTPEAL